MNVEIRMPEAKGLPEEARLLKWRTEIGERVARGEIVAEAGSVESPWEIRSGYDGVVTSLLVREGAFLERGRPILLLDRSQSGIETGVSATARRIALGFGEAADQVGRSAMAQKQPGEPPEETAVGEKCLKVRRIMERKMVEGWQQIPHFYVRIAVDMTDVIRLRKEVGVTINDFVMAAAIRSLGEHPWVNSHWVDGEAVEKKLINVAMAVATDRGLYHPVIQDCSGLSLQEIAVKSQELSSKAHKGKLGPSDMEDGTFTITNIGRLGVESFSAIITPPQAAVLAVGTVQGEVVVDDSGEPAVAPIVRLTLSADHRVMDGADAADFLATLKCYLEAPVTLITPSSFAEEL